MGLTILSDEQICYLLEGLTVAELEAFRGALQATLHEYSTSTQSVVDGTVHQPERTSVYAPRTGATTLFMPSSSPVGHGVKVITLSSAENQGASDEGKAADKAGSQAAKPPPQPALPVISPTGAITLFHANGAPAGILHARTLTAFRTALASLCLVRRRATVRTLTVFGAGEQAYWHVRLTLLLRGATVRQVNVINRQFSPRCRALLARLHAGVPAAQRAREGWADCAFGVLTPGYGEYARLLREQVRAADIVFCCTPATAPLFEPGLLTNREGRRKGRLVVAVGSYTPRMRELPVEVLLQATRAHEGRRHFHRHAAEGGVVVVDTLDGALKEAGEVIEAGLGPRQLVELGELVMLQLAAPASPESDSESEQTAISASTTTTPSAELERLNLNPNPNPNPTLNTPGSPGPGKTSSAVSVPALSTVLRPGSSSGTGPSPSTPSSRASSPSAPGKGNALRSMPSYKRSSSHSSVERRRQKDDGLARWLATGNVVYKSVGLGLMDLAVGMHLIGFARAKGVGLHVEDF